MADAFEEINPFAHEMTGLTDGSEIGAETPADQTGWRPSDRVLLAGETSRTTSLQIAAALRESLDPATTAQLQAGIRLEN